MTQASTLQLVPALYPKLAKRKEMVVRWEIVKENYKHKTEQSGAEKTPREISWYNRRTQHQHPKQTNFKREPVNHEIAPQVCFYKL